MERFHKFCYCKIKSLSNFWHKCKFTLNETLFKKELFDFYKRRSIKKKKDFSVILKIL